jgi:hypothetical protein
MPDFYSAREDRQCGKNTPMVSHICWGAKKPLTSLRTQACSWIIQSYIQYTQIQVDIIEVGWHLVEDPCFFVWEMGVLVMKEQLPISHNPNFLFKYVLCGRHYHTLMLQICVHSSLS